MTTRTREFRRVHWAKCLLVLGLVVPSAFAVSASVRHNGITDGLAARKPDFTATEPVALVLFGCGLISAGMLLRRNQRGSST